MSADRTDFVIDAASAGDASHSRLNTQISDLPRAHLIAEKLAISRGPVAHKSPYGANAAVTVGLEAGDAKCGMPSPLEALAAPTISAFKPNGSLATSESNGVCNCSVSCVNDNWPKGPVLK